MTEMQVINFFWNITLGVIIIAAVVMLATEVLGPLAAKICEWVEELIIIIKHEKQRKDAIARYKSENPIFKDDLPEDKR